MKKQVLLDTKWLTVWRESFRLPNGVLVPEYYLVARPDVAVIVPLLKIGKVLMLRQWRPIPRKYIYNLPMGFIDPTDPSPLAAAQRELGEEVGCRARSWIKLGSYWRAPSYLTTKIHFFLAQCHDLPGALRGQERHEALAVETMDFEDAMDSTPDLTSRAALSLAEVWLKKKKKPQGQAARV